MAGKDDWVEDVRRWCFESSRPAEASLDGADTGDASAHGTAGQADAITAACSVTRRDFDTPADCQRVPT